MEDMRPTNEVFKSVSAAKDEAFRSRFASSGKFEKAELEAGGDLQKSSEEQEEVSGVVQVLSSLLNSPCGEQAMVSTHGNRRQISFPRPTK